MATQQHPSQTFDAEKGSTDEGSSHGSDRDPSIDPEFERRVWRKVDLWVIPVVSMFSLLCLMDRTNLGNARVAGLQAGLKMTNMQYTIALTVTYVPYIAADLPSNLLLKVVGPNLMLPAMMTLWGVVTTMQGVVTTYKGLLAARFFLGLCEGGVFPGLVLYLSLFYPRQQLQWRVSAFYSSGSLAAAFSGLLAFAIIHMNGKGGKPGWAWIFILEGVFTALFGLLSFVLLPASPSTARFLDEKEEAYVIARMKEDGAAGRSDSLDAFSWAEVGRAFMLPQVQIMAVCFFFSGTIIYALAFFGPSIVQSLGFTASHAQLFSVPPFATGFFAAMLGAYISDRFHCRGLVSVFASLLCVIGFAIFLKSESHHVQYGSLFLSISGVTVATPTFFTWTSNNAAPHTRRATAIAIGFIMTNSGGVLATWLLGTLSPPPFYTLATQVSIAFSVGMLVLSAANIWYLWSQNKKKAKYRLNHAREDEKEGLGDRSAWLQYAL